MLLAIVRQSFIYLIKNINFYFFMIFLYSFCADVRANWAVCSFIRTNIIFSNFLSFILYFFCTFFVLFCLVYYFRCTSSIVNSDWLVALYRAMYVSNIPFLTLVSYIFDVLANSLFYFLRVYGDSLFITAIFNFIAKFFSVNYWYPLYKRHSYFGYFRSMRQRWGEVKTEEVNRLKY